MNAENPKSSQQEISKDVKTNTLEFQKLFRKITEEDLRTEIIRRIYRRIAIKSSLENFRHTDVDDEEFCQNHDCPEPDTQSNEKL